MRTARRLQMLARCESSSTGAFNILAQSVIFCVRDRCWKRNGEQRGGINIHRQRHRTSSWSMRRFRLSPRHCPLTLTASRAASVTSQSLVCAIAAPLVPTSVRHFAALRAPCDESLMLLTGSQICASCAAMAPTHCTLAPAALISCCTFLTPRR